MLKLVLILFSSLLVCAASPTGLAKPDKLSDANPARNSIKSANDTTTIATPALVRSIATGQLTGALESRPVKTNQVGRLDDAPAKNASLPSASETEKIASSNRINSQIAEKEKSLIKSGLTGDKSGDQSSDQFSGQSINMVKSIIKANTLVQPKERQPHRNEPHRAFVASNFDLQPYEARFDDNSERSFSNGMLANHPSFYDQMQNDYQAEEQVEEGREEESKFDFADPDPPEVFFTEENFDQANDQTYVSTLATSACEVDKCKSANQTDPNLYLVDCLSENLVYKCYYCPKEHVLVKKSHTCIGPCENEEDCQKLLDYYKHVECPSDYLESQKDLNTCEKMDSVRNEKPLSISFFYPKHWKLRQPVARVNGTANLQANTTDQADPNNSNRMLVHQIQLKDFKDENNRDACEFKMQIESINGQRPFDDERPNQFTMEIKPDRDGGLINVYLDASSIPESAMVSLSCTYKEIVLHRSELHFLEDNN